MVDYQYEMVMTCALGISSCRSHGHVHGHEGASATLVVLLRLVRNA